MIKKQILILEVNQHNFDVLNSLLKKHEFTCKAVLNLNEFNIVKKNIDEYNLILVNTSINYLDLTQTIFESNFDGSVKIPTVFIDSAELYSEEKLDKCFKAGGCDYIKKPFASLEIIDRVSYHCEVFTKLQEYRLRMDKLANLATVDQLSKLTSKMQMQVILKYQIDYYNRYQTDTTIVYFSLININKIIGMFGLYHGEKLILLFAKELKKLIRKSDVLARWEGSDFILILTNTSEKLSEVFIKKMSAALSRAESIEKSNLEIAFGITSFMENDEMKNVIERAKYALYEAKQQRYGKIFIA
ncbi:diguanylate cyclase [Sulfurimonas sp. NW7]|uniref:diguanylate cyclase domain-containing protein n=1 Tax=Sulfurimonas sp. NW7 TaxID=2922727 RepID=UPI003DA93456